MQKKKNQYRELLQQTSTMNIDMVEHMNELAQVSDDIYDNLAGDEMHSLSILLSAVIEVQNEDVDTEEKYHALQKYIYDYVFARRYRLEQAVEHRQIDSALLKSAQLGDNEKH